MSCGDSLLSAKFYYLNLCTNSSHTYYVPKSLLASRLPGRLPENSLISTPLVEWYAKHASLAPSVTRDQFCSLSSFLDGLKVKEGMFILKSFYLKASCYLRLPDCSNPGSLTSARTREKFELTETGRIL